MSTTEEKLEAPQHGQAGRPRATLRQLRRRYNGPLEKWPKAPESIFIRQAITNRLELWKLVGGQAGEDSGAPRAGRGVTATGEESHLSTDPRSREVNHTGRTLAECCELQQVPLWVVESFSKRDAHALVGNAVPPPVAAHIGRLVIEADRAEQEAA